MLNSAGWMFVFLFIGAVIAGFRIWQNLQKLRRHKNDSWDARLIDQLRKRGSDPFKPHEVDFFLAFPSRETADRLAAELGQEGFTCDVKEAPENGALAFSLHAQKSMQLSVADMQDLSRRLTDAAKLLGGRYDGWSAPVVERSPGPIS